MCFRHKKIKCLSSTSKTRGPEGPVGSPDLLNNVKIGQGQPRFTIFANLVGPTSPMLHTKYQGHWPFGSREEDIYRVYTLYGHGSHLGHVTRTICIIFG